jgi:hypothetical protein
VRKAARAKVVLIRSTVFMAKRRAVELSEDRKQRLDETVRKKRADDLDEDKAIHDMVRRSIEKHGA